jgi:hypothetical protein
MLGCWLSILGLSAALPAGASDWKFDVRTGLEVQGETDLDTVGEFDFVLWNLGARAASEVAQDLVVSVDGDYRLIGYDFSGLGFEPWETIHVLTFTPSLAMQLNPELSLLVGPIFEFSGETDADFDESLTVGGRLAGTYRFSDSLHVTLGVVVSSEIEDDVYVQPLVAVNWGISDDLNLRMLAESTRGGEARLAYNFLEDWTASIGAGFRRERFRLNDDGPAARRDGVGEEEATVISGRLAYAFAERISLEGYIGGTLDGEFDLDNERGNGIADSDYDDAVYGGLRFTIGF